MQTIREVVGLRVALAELRASGTVALVPTMGALHAGHMALVRAAAGRGAAGRGAAGRAAYVVASIFVNPTQFGPGEDLDAYPRREAADAAMLETAGVAVLWAPGVAEMYRQGFATRVSVAGIGGDLCGASRPGHFDGVATVVAKLFGQVRPDVALFGEKDWQQLAVIRRMARDLDIGVEIVGVPVQRDADGVALSSRNAYLTPGERETARTLPAALLGAAEAIEGGAGAAETLRAAIDKLEGVGVAVEYFELRDAASLGPAVPGRPARLLAAVRVGATRLIDNVPVMQR